MAARLQLVTTETIAALKADPARINALDEPDYVFTYWFGTILYFLCGDAWPNASKRKPLTGMFFGFEDVSTPTLENGAFGVVTPAQAKAIAKALAQVDLAALSTAVAEADPDELADADADDFELLVTDDDDPPGTIVADVELLRAFYEEAAATGRGVVMYTS